MKSYSRDLLLLLKKTPFSSEQLEKEMACLNRILMQVECPEAFCIAHQLATRFTISDKWKDLLKITISGELKPFHFLINKN